MSVKGYFVSVASEICWVRCCLSKYIYDGPINGAHLILDLALASEFSFHYHSQIMERVTNSYPF